MVREIISKLQHKRSQSVQFAIGELYEALTQGPASLDTMRQAVLAATREIGAANAYADAIIAILEDQR